MATAKKKTSAKRTVKYAAKSQSSAKHTASAAPAWVSKGAADWQKGANEWAKQSAKLYQMPFAQGDVDAAAKKAADQVKSAADNMMKMSNEMMQLFSQQSKSAKASASQSFNPQAYFQQFQGQMPQMPQFDMSAMQEKIASCARECSDQLSKASQAMNRAAAETTELSQENIQAMTEVCNVAVAVCKELMAEMISYCNKQFSQNVELSKQALSCRTLNDMFDLATRITKANLDAFFSESVKISEMLFQCGTDISEPLNERMSETTERLTKAISA